jgi:hypothetical protein
MEVRSADCSVFFLLGSFGPDGGGAKLLQKSIAICHLKLCSIPEFCYLHVEILVSLSVTNSFGSLFNKFTFKCCCNSVLVIVFVTFSMKHFTCQMFQNVNAEK